MSIKKRKFLSKSEAKELFKKLNSLGISFKFTVNDKIEELELENGDKIFLINSTPLFCMVDNIIIPTLFSKSKSELPFAVVDEGAVPHILNGADVMAPGIISFPSNISEKSIILIKSTKGESIAIGEVLEEPYKKLNNKKGKVIKNLHYKNDKIYVLCINLIRNLLSESKK